MIPPENTEPVEPVSSRPPARQVLGCAARILGAALLGLFLWSILWVSVYRFAGPPFTYLTLQDRIQGEAVDRRPVRLSSISPHLPRAIIAAEDQLFCSHGGFDWTAISKAQDYNERSNRTRGASTISMQTAKNAFLWPSRTWFRKGAEAYFTVLIETFWPKRRILEVYLNVAEWGHGIYGVEAAARYYFGKPAAQLTRSEAALLAAALPTPLRSNPSRPTPYLQGRANSILYAMDKIEVGCLD